MSMQPYSPVEELIAWNNIHRFMSDVLSLRPSQLGELMIYFSRPLDLYETANGYDIHYPIAAAKPDSIEVTVHNNMVSVIWETGTTVPADARQIHGGIQRGLHQEQFTLPVELDAQSAGASYEHGVLYIHVAKAAPSSAKTIRIQPENSSVPTPEPMPKNTKNRKESLSPDMQI